MSVARSTTVLAASLTVLALGLWVMFDNPYAIASHILQMQFDVWQRLGARNLTRPVWAQAAEIGFLTVAGMGAIFLMLRTRIYWAGLFVLGALVTAFYAALLLARAEAIALNIVTPGAVLFLVFALGGSVRHNQIQTRKRELRFAFADSLAPAAIEKIARDPSLLSLDGETRDITYLVCGIRGLAELSESLDRKSVV